MFNKIKQWIRFRRHDDAYAMTRESMWRSVHQACLAQQADGRIVWLVAHFPDTFTTAQNQLATWQLPYCIAGQSLDPDWLQDNLSAYLMTPGTIHLVLSALIPEITFSSSRWIDRDLAVIVVERHPIFDHDVKIHNYCRQLGARMQLGYFQSFEDALVAGELDKMTLTLMQQMGLNNHSLVNSLALTRRIDRRLKRNRPRYTSDIEADNFQRWHELNAPEAP